jgi:hypothetical protein
MLCHIEKQRIPLHRQRGITLQDPLEMMAAQYRAAKTLFGVCVLVGEKLEFAVKVAKTRRFDAGSVRPVKIPVLLSSEAITSA